eukprot:7311888-Pyramimonas_sp.AAC.1
MHGDDCLEYCMHYAESSSRRPGCHGGSQHTSTEYSSPRPITAAFMQNIPHPGQSDCYFPPGAGADD